MILVKELKNFQNKIKQPQLKDRGLTADRIKRNTHLAVCILY